MQNFILPDNIFIIKIITIISITLFAITLFAQDQIADFPAKGKYDVSFQVLSLYDSSRTIADHKCFRPVPMIVWFPAHLQGKSDPFTYKDYFILSAADAQIQASKSFVQSFSNFNEQKTIVNLSNTITKNLIE